MALIASILSKFDDSGIKHAQSSFGGLKKALVAGLSFEAVKQVGEELVKFAEVADKDQKSMQLLNSQLTRNAHATKGQTAANEKFINTLSQQVGITKDRLRPAQAKLARATHDVTGSQKLLKLALDASAVSGKPLETVSMALAKAYTGQTGALTRMFPELKKSKNALGDLKKEVSGAAAQQATPFDKMNVAMQNMQIKLGTLILPFLEKIIDFLTKPGGVLDQVSKFFDELGNPKTDVGKYFKDNVMPILDLIGTTIGDLVVALGKLFKGDFGKAFIGSLTIVLKTLEAILWVADQVVQILGEIGSGKIAAKAAKSNKIEGSTLSFTGGKDIQGGKFKATGDVFSFGGIGAQNQIIPNSGATVNNITINATSADPKATVDAVSKYVKTNGGLPSSWKPSY